MPPEAFALAEGPDLVTDLVDKDIWNSIMNLPDDVSLRTSDNHGTELNYMHKLWSSIINLTENEKDIIWYHLLDISDELMASIVNSLIGFYRTAASSLRNSLELAANGAYYQRCKNLAEYEKWRKSQNDIRFGNACSQLNALDDVKEINDYLFSKMRDTLLEERNSRYHGYPGGWTRKLYSNLSGFVHSRPDYSSGDMWQSNGPIYSGQAYGRISALYCDTLALIYVLIKLSRPKLELPAETKLIFKFPNVMPSKISIYTYRYLWKDAFKL